MNDKMKSAVRILVLPAVFILSSAVSGSGAVYSQDMLFAQGTTADDSAGLPPEDSKYYRIELNKGTVLIARKTGETPEKLDVVTAEGILLTIEKKSILSIREADFDVAKQEYRRRDPNYTRLLFSPTGRPLKQGEGYISDYYVVLPGVAYGLTDNISLSAGVSIMPNPDFFTKQVAYLAPRVGMEISANWAVSGGFIAGFPTSTEMFRGFGSLIYGVTTYGPRDLSLTVGAAYGFLYYVDSSRESPGGHKTDKRHYDDWPVIVVGGNIRLANSVALVSENWIIAKDLDTLKSSPLGLAVRLFGDSIAVDLGFLFIYDIIKQGFPIPWLSFIYNF